MDGNQSAAQVLDFIVPTVSVTAIKLSRHTGRDCRYPEHREVNLARPPWPLGSGIPYWNDGVFLNLMAVTVSVGTHPVTLCVANRWSGQTAFPRWSVTAIKLSVYRNAKPQLGIRVYRAKLGLGVPSRADFTLNASFNLMAVTLERGNDRKSA